MGLRSDHGTSRGLRGRSQRRSGDPGARKRPLSAPQRGAAGTCGRLGVGAAVLGLFAAVLVALRAPTPATAASVAKNPPAPQSVPQPRPAPETATGDFADPPRPDAMAAGFQVRKGHTGFDAARSTPEDDATTSGTQRRYRNPDGSRTLLLSQTPVRFRDRSGRWVDIDRSLVAAPDGSLEPKAAPEGVHLSKSSQGAIATLDTPAGPIALRHPDVVASAVTVRGDTASYANALPGGRDVALAAADGGLEETVTLSSPAAGPTYVDDVVLPAGVTARQGDGRVELVDANGTVVAAVDGGSAFDATFPTNIGAATPVSVRLVSADAVPAGGSTVPSTTSTTVAPAAQPPAEAKVARVEVSVDSRWLAAAKFPVRIDPTFRAYFTAAASGGVLTGTSSAAPTPALPMPTTTLPLVHPTAAPASPVACCGSM